MVSRCFACEKIGHEWSLIGWNLSETLFYLMTFEYAKFANLSLSRPYLVPRLTRHRTRMKQTNRNLSKLLEPGGKLKPGLPITKYGVISSWQLCANCAFFVFSSTSNQVGLINSKLSLGPRALHLSNRKIASNVHLERIYFSYTV